MNLNFYVEPDEILDLRSCYRYYWKAQVKAGLTEEENNFCAETLSLLLHIHLTITQPQHSVTVPLTYAEWLSIREAVIDYLPMLQNLGLTTLIGKYERLLQKLDASTLAVYIAKAEETAESNVTFTLASQVPA